jgi:hypothetical protein
LLRRAVDHDLQAGGCVGMKAGGFTTHEARAEGLVGGGPQRFVDRPDFAS